MPPGRGSAARWCVWARRLSSDARPKPTEDSPPGFISTPLLEKNLDQPTLAAIAQMHPIQRLGTGQEVAELVAFLGSDAAAFCTGGYYLVDGAYTAH